MNIHAGIRGFWGRLIAPIRGCKPVSVELSQTSHSPSLCLPDFGQDNVSMREIYRRCYNNDFGVGLPPAARRTNDQG